MSQIFHISRRLLGSKYAAIFIFSLVIVVKLLQLVYLLDTRADLSFQTQVAQSLVSGHGITIPFISEEDLSAQKYAREIRWPPGYSLLLAPLLIVFGHNYLLAVFTLNFFFFLALLVVCRKLLLLLNVELFLVNLATAILGLGLPYFQLKLCSDSIAITFLLAAFHEILKCLKRDRSTTKSFAFIITSLLLCAGIKYLYFPIVFVLPAYLFLYGYRRHNKQLRMMSMTILLMLAVFLGGLLLYQKLTSGSAASIQQTTRGFFPENLRQLHPFIPAAFVKPETFTSLAPARSKLVEMVFMVIQIAAMVGWLFLISKLARRKLVDLSAHYFLLGTAIAFAIFGLLCFLSLRVAPELVWNGSQWTYVQESRYYGFIHVFLLLAAFIFLQKLLCTGVKNKVWIGGLILLLLLPETLRGLIFATNRAVNYNKEVYGWQYELGVQKAVAAAIDKIRLQYPGHAIVLAGSSDWMTIRASLYTQLPIYQQPLRLNDVTTFRTSKPVLVFTIIRDTEVEFYQSFMAIAEKNSAGTYQNFRFYAYPVQPN